MNKYKLAKIADISLKVCCALFLLVSLLLTFTVSDYYIFNRIGFGEGKYNPFFVISQWIKKTGLLLLPLAAYYGKKRCADVAKYVLPVFTVISLFTYGNFFNATMLTPDASQAQRVYASINEFIGKTANMTLFFTASALELLCCALLFVKHGYKISGAKSFIYLPVSVAAIMPLNIFENFYDVNKYGRNSFLWFRNFTVWHFLALAILVATTVGFYFFLRKKEKRAQQDRLVATAITLLIQYHSKDSFVMGDGYNVYNYVFSCVPLFICNIGVYIASLSVILRKRILYAISFFVHAAGALTVFVYFGRDDISNYGIFIGHSILYFCLTHALLFVLAVIPSALGHYKFKMRDCFIPMAYYCVVIIAAAICSGLVTSYSMNLSYEGYTLAQSELIYPNYAFTQINPLPIPCPTIPLRIWRCELNLLYLILLYLVYVSLFWTFTGGYYAFIAIRRKIYGKQQTTATILQPDIETAADMQPNIEIAEEIEIAEAAATTECTYDNEVKDS